MAESNRLEQPGLDTAAGEEFLREAVQVLLDEAVRKGTDVTEKVGEGWGGGGAGGPRWAGLESWPGPRPRFPAGL